MVCICGRGRFGKSQSIVAIPACHYTGVAQWMATMPYQSAYKGADNAACSSTTPSPLLCSHNLLRLRSPLCLSSLSNNTGFQQSTSRSFTFYYPFVSFTVNRARFLSNKSQIAVLNYNVLWQI